MDTNLDVKNKSSIKHRLVYWTVGLLTLVILLLCFTSIFAVSNQLLIEIDTRISSEAKDVRRSISVSEGEIVINESIEWEEDHHTEEGAQPIYIFLFDDKKNEIKQSDNSIGKTLPMFRITFSEEKSYHFTDTWYETRTRFYIEPLHLATGHLGWFVLAMPMGKIAAMLALIMKNYLILLPFCLLIGVLGSVYIAAKTLDPVRDITIKATELNYQRLNEPLPIPDTNDEISDLALSINNLLIRLKNDFSSIQEFTAHASHELKTPLSIIKLELEELDRKLEEKSTVLSPRVKQEIYRIAKIVDDLALLAKVDSNIINIEKNEIWINDILFTEIEHFLPIAKSSKIALKVGHADSRSLQGDEYWVRTMISNIIDNALKYSPEESTVICNVQSFESELRLSITDEGQGVEPQQLSQLTKRFFRSDSVSSIPGSGLGLAIVDWVVNQHDGTIQFENNEPNGLIVLITLPCQVNKAI